LRLSGWIEFPALKVYEEGWEDVAFQMSPLEFPEAEEVLFLLTSNLLFFE
jgi:hypothetical protein